MRLPGSTASVDEKALQAFKGLDFLKGPCLGFGSGVEVLIVGFGDPGFRVQASAGITMGCNYEGDPASKRGSYRKELCKFNGK